MLWLRKKVFHALTVYLITTVFFSFLKVRFRAHSCIAWFVPSDLCSVLVVLQVLVHLTLGFRPWGAEHRAQQNWRAGSYPRYLLGYYCSIKRKWPIMMITEKTQRVLQVCIHHNVTLPCLSIKASLTLKMLFLGAIFKVACWFVTGMWNLWHSDESIPA